MAGLFWRAVDYIKEQKRKREYEENKKPIEIALEIAKRNFDESKFSTYNLDKIREGIKKGLDVRYCLISYDFQIQDVLEILEFEKEERLMPGTILKPYYNGYTIYSSEFSGYVRRVKEERKRQQVANDINGFFRQR